MRMLVTGGAGFIGSHLCDRLLALGFDVWCVDNLRLGRRRNIAHLENDPRFHFVLLDVLDKPLLDDLFVSSGFNGVFHLAANSDIREGNSDPELDLNLNFRTTLNVLSAMKVHGVRKLFFASTSAIFGEAEGPLAEDAGPLEPISFYGASKLAAEAYISVFARTYADLQAVVLRFPNVVGERATHGAIFDFIQRLKSDSARLEVLGNGSQRKPYLYVGDLIEAITLVWETARNSYEVYHASGVGETTVKEIAEIVVSEVGSPTTTISYSQSDRGWPGDVPHFSYDISKLRGLGWAPTRHSTDAVRHAVNRITANGF